MQQCPDLLSVSSYWLFTHSMQLPLHHFLFDDLFIGIAIKKESILILLEFYPNAVNSPDEDGWLPIHIAATKCSVDILRVITEANPGQLSATIPMIGSVAHYAAFSEPSTNICYIHSELFHRVNEQHQTPLQNRTEEWPELVQETVNLVPETARNVDSKETISYTHS